MLDAPMSSLSQANCKSGGRCNPVGNTGVPEISWKPKMICNTIT